MMSGVGHEMAVLIAVFVPAYGFEMRVFDIFRWIRSYPLPKPGSPGDSGKEHVLLIGLLMRMMARTNDHGIILV